MSGPQNNFIQPCQSFRNGAQNSINLMYDQIKQAIFKLIFLYGLRIMLYISKWTLKEKRFATYALVTMRNVYKMSKRVL